MQLLQKLLTLGDTIQELRQNQRSSSEASLSSAEEDDECCPLQFSASTSAITRLYVSDCQDDSDDGFQPNVQYFSRKNSILRIPIPPRASNRMLGKRLVS